MKESRLIYATAKKPTREAFAKSLAKQQVKAPPKNTLAVKVPGGLQKTKYDPGTVKQNSAGIPQSVGGVKTQVNFGVKSPMRPTATVGKIGYTGPWSTVEQAQKAARDEYERTGSVSPATEAAIFNLQRREGMVPTPVAPSSIVPSRGGASTGGSTAPKPTPTKIFTGQDLIAEANSRRETRLKQMGLGEGEAIRKIFDSGAKPVGWENGQAVFQNPDGTTFRSGFAGSNVDRMYQDYTNTTVESEAKNIQGEQQGAIDRTSAQSLTQTPGLPNAGQTADQMAGEQPGNTMDSTIPTPQATGNVAQQGAALDPRLQAGITPGIQAANDTRKAADVLMEQARGDAAAIESSAQKSFDQGAQDAAAQREAEIAFNAKVDQQQRERAEEIKRQELADLARTDQLQKVENARAEQLVREKNTDQEMKNRILAARLGINMDTGGIKWMQEEVRRGNDTLAYIIQKAALSDQETADKRYAVLENYRLNMNQIDLEKQKDYATAWSTYNSTIKNLKAEKGLSDKEARTLRKEAREKYATTVAQVDKDKAQLYKDAHFKMYEEEMKQAKKDLEGAFDTGDALDLTMRLADRINSNKTITAANEVDSFYGALVAGDKRYKAIQADIKAGKLDPKKGEVSLNAAQTAIVQSLGKILDPGSVVRNEEYERQVYGQAFLNKAKGFFESIEKGGAGLTATDIAEMKKIADDIHKSWEERFSKAIHPIILSIDKFNSHAGAGAQIDYAEVIDVDRVHLPRQTFDRWKGDAYDTSGTKNPGGVGGWLSAQNAPPGGYRTDRHNNPTAFMVELAKQGGLVEGVDYIYDKNLANGFPTAKLLGDPIAQTIRVIDNVGFYTGKGAQRWTHTALDKKDWDAMTYNQKAAFITKMYQREGGTGVLIAQGPNMTSAVPMSRI